MTFVSHVPACQLLFLRNFPPSSHVIHRTRDSFRLYSCNMTAVCWGVMSCMLLRVYHTVVSTKRYSTNTSHIFPERSSNNWFKIFSVIHLYLKSCHPHWFCLFIGKFYSIIHRKNTGSFSPQQIHVCTERSCNGTRKIRYLSDNHWSFIPIGSEYFYFHIMSSLALRITQPPIQLACGFCPRGKAAGIWSKDSPLSSAKIVYAWSDVFSPPYAMALEQLDTCQITTDLSFPTGQNIFIFRECLGWR